jgi:nucleotide-binding universal stress UspA family protein/hemerythrin-like domain-containing protein
VYRHLLVPIDGTAYSTDTVGRAVEFAVGVGARITFFHASVGFDLFQDNDDAFASVLTPRMYAQQSALRSREILAKAQAPARPTGVHCDAICKPSDVPHEAIVATAREQQCDLIFMASHAKSGLRGMLGSQTHKVLAHSDIPVLVATTATSAPRLNKAIAIIQDEHRALAVVIRALLTTVGRARAQRELPRFELFKQMLRYVEEFPETLHHPKEELYLFRALRERTDEVNEVIMELERQHVEGKKMLQDMQSALVGYIAGMPDGLAGFAHTVDRFAQAQWHHIKLEEKIILPAARKYLNEQDWAAIAAAFGKNGDPRFAGAIDEQFHEQFSQILSMAA